jgi:hypothetical protein
MNSDVTESGSEHIKDLHACIVRCKAMAVQTRSFNNGYACKNQNENDVSYNVSDNTIKQDQTNS